ncbi:hypothetical protein vseg_013587 [Gypsophila vaccaria]
MATLPVDDRDLDDAALWAVIDSASAASYSSPTTKKSSTPRFRSPLALANSHTPPSKSQYYKHSSNNDDIPRPNKILKPSPELTAHWDIKPVQPAIDLAGRDLSPYVQETVSPSIQHHHHRVAQHKENHFTHCLSGSFPTVSLFKDYQDAAMAVLDKSDYTMISGNPFIKKSGWRKIAFYFNVSFEIKDKTIEFDDKRDVQRAEFIVRAYMQGGRFSDGWGSCERREKRFMKPNSDIPSTAETRAKNKACQDLIGIGQYRPSSSHNHNPNPR